LQNPKAGVLPIALPRKRENILLQYRGAPAEKFSARRPIGLKYIRPDRSLGGLIIALARIARLHRRTGCLPRCRQFVRLLKHCTL